ncbi:carbohydrate ABC transporter permease [Aquibacillus kalidii]|uniref:carbohydrate ABC transporter permease n=1 Tax=Aquibacillus kalidii TaxID=2762597 RepID=UPI001F17A702|nr:carbohydrate ABC transporter permease [Aquibacillus kalidii]
MRIKKVTSKRFFIYLILSLFAIANAYPIVWMVLNSLKTADEFALDRIGLPEGFAFQNYIDAWNTANFGSFFVNSLIVSLVSVVITVFLGALAAYFLSRFQFRMSKFIYGFFVFGLLVPVHATLVPMFILMSKLGLLNTHFSLILPYVAFNMPISIFLLVSFMKSFPKDIEESAIMDGAGILKIFWSIILPMTRPAIATVVILSFINNWNEFVFALVLINDPALATLPLGLQNFAGQYETNYVGQMAGLTMALVPILIVYLFLEKELVKGMTAGAVKG